MSQATIDRPLVDDHAVTESAPASPTGVTTGGNPLRAAAIWLVGVLPTIAVLAALGGVALWGHHTGWKISSFAELSGQAAVDDDDWCVDHNVPESECVECDPDLLPKMTDYGWCPEHGVHQCPLCHPDVAELKKTPVIDPQQRDAATRALAVRDREENSEGCRLYRSRVQFASRDAVKKAGIDFDLVETRPMVEAVRANGQATYDETRVAQLASRVPGIVWRVERNVGDPVRRGDILALVDATEVGKTKSELLDSLAQVDFHVATVARLKPLAAKQIVPGFKLLEAETALQQARISVRRAAQALDNLGLHVELDELKRIDEDQRGKFLRFLGLPEDIRGELEDSAVANNLIPLVASLDGVVIQRATVRGEVVNSSKMLFRIADTSRMWLRFNVSLEHASHLSVGQPVRFHPDGTQDEVSGLISWISTDVDKQTRTLELRAEVDNPDGTLRNETFGLGQIILRESPEAVVVPQDAVQWDGSCFVVFVRDRHYFEKDYPKLFHTRTVRPGVTADGETEIIVGLLPGEVVVTKGSALLRSQILKNNLGAGCTCGH